MEFVSLNLLPHLVQLLISVLLFAPHSTLSGANAYYCTWNTCAPELTSGSQCGHGSAIFAQPVSCVLTFPLDGGS
jgi:hypothetical protein